MRDADIPNVLKVKNPGPEIFSLAGRINLPPGKETDVNLGALHDIHRAPTYIALLNSLAGGAIEFVSGPENFKLPTQVAQGITRRDKLDAEGVADAQRKAQAIADRPDGTPTLPVIKPPAQQVAIPPVSNPVGSDAGGEFVPPKPPSASAAADAKATAKVSAKTIPPPPPAPPAPPAAPAKPTPDSDSAQPDSPLSDL